jgi:pentatricopeptide repeat protein
LEKVDVNYPDFKHKKTQHRLWIEDQRNPLWVQAKLASMAPGTVPLDNFSWNRRLVRYVKAGQHEKAVELFQKMQQKGTAPDTFTFIPVLNACASLGALKEGRQVREQIIQSVYEADVFVGFTCMPHVGAWRMHRECSTRCHHMMWSLGMPYLEDVPCMAMVMKLLNILNRCVKKVYSQMISLLFVFWSFLAMLAIYSRQKI